MIEKKITIKSIKGLHARPCALLVKMLSKSKSDVKILKDDMEVDAKSIMSILILAAGRGTELNFVINGQDEQNVSRELEEFFNSDFEEMNAEEINTNEK
ncbi:MAG: HPr family phosphocarrier protein [Elusimicrobiota bacterium]|jgi:phosphocarrier protein|nr:HPr family phosphocarrier protein [Elusimicrobiota bacterium]